MQPVVKNKTYTVDIHDLGRKGEGVGRYEGFLIYVPGALPGDTIDCLIVKVKKRYAFGKCLGVIKASADRVEPPCPIAERCGGCQIQTLDYAAQCRHKVGLIEAALTRIGGFSDLPMLPFRGMEDPFRYRNKGQFAIGERDGDIEIGLYQVNSHRIIGLESCPIQHESTDAILGLLRERMMASGLTVYDEANQTGLLRYVMLRSSFSNDEVMICLVVAAKRISRAQRDGILGILEDLPGVSSAYVNCNDDPGDRILGANIEYLFGKTHIRETIGDLSFKISPQSFFQVNPRQTAVLFECIREFAALESTDVLWDLYCGTGSIGLMLAKDCDVVLGIDCVASAIEDAKKNALENGVDNARFICGDVERILFDLDEEESLRSPSAVVLDPPRKGCDERFLEGVLSRKPERIVYVSCNPATLARDLQVLAREYCIEAVQGVDMFAHTVHVETIVKLSRNEA